MDFDTKKYTTDIELSSDHELPMSFKSSREIKRICKKKYNNTDKIVSDAIKKSFGKYIEIDNKNCELPEPNKLFIDSPWIINDLYKLKCDLNGIKSKLNDYKLIKWKCHTSRRNYGGHVAWHVRNEINPEFLTQAWCKLYENLSFIKLIPDKCINKHELKSIHLCEAPGAFVTALNHWLKLNEPSINWNWTATTLNPCYEGNSLSYMLNDDRFMLYTMNNWHFGIDNTGNIMKLNNLNSLIELEKDNRDKIMLITADGSIDCFHIPDEQEKLVSHLHYCETIAALHLLMKNGNFLIKLFTIFECQTVCLMYLLSCCFNKIIIRKPATSKEGNSEVYVFCLDFKGYDYVSPYLNIFKRYYEDYTDSAMFRINDIPYSFIEQIVASGELFKSYQSEVILNNIKTYNLSINYNDIIIKKIRKGIADYYIKFCKLTKLPSDSMKIVGENILAQSHYHMCNNKWYKSYNDKQLVDNMKSKERLLIIMEDFNCIDDINFINTIQFTDEKPVELKISTAIPYDNIHISKFCQPKILNNYILTCEIENKLIGNQNYPNDNEIQQLINTNKNNKFITFHYTLKYDGINVITKIYQAIINLKYDETLVLIGYSMLFQFNVGIFYLLANTFKRVEMYATNKIGCVITFCNYICVQDIIKNLEIIYDATIMANNNNEIILSVLPIVQLCDCKLYPIILDLNHLVIKYYVNQVLMAVNNSK